MVKEYKATIYYEIDEKHPDINYLPNWRKGLILDFSDTYRFNTDIFCSLDERVAYMKKDLGLIAGGGYESYHIHNVRYDIVEL